MLFIFEARYRLLIQQFGMVLPNFVSNGVGDAEGTPFMEYGTMLQIDSIQVYADGHSHIWTVGDPSLGSRSGATGMITSSLKSNESTISLLPTRKHSNSHA
ncbi:hypothetical protein BZA05DRAFT_37111 [Tricharina praecox]|uniref:uncharacterized protein n=1 Tax=Tricharina praecox TaxID=43433 RepID=UPI002220FFD3|nr:uncharacterized protein BZA05DRAFT_37111 [Tricharina praecox]KAI5852153.1 hypothetical protein BZA05DRAFT_37111 [Tricharina praecox]